MAIKDMDLIDEVAMFLGTGLLFLGIVVLGVVELLDGKPYGAAPLTNDAGDVIATPGVDPAIRTGLVFLGLVVLGLYGAYKLLAPADGVGTPTRSETPAK